jgi:hypothetical protein
MVVVIMIGILVYIQMINGDISNNPLFAPPTKEVKKVEIKRIVEGFSMSEGMDISSYAADVNGDIDNGAHDIIDDNERNEHELHETFNEYYENKKKK